MDGGTENATSAAMWRWCGGGGERCPSNIIFLFQVVPYFFRCCCKRIRLELKKKTRSFEKLKKRTVKKNNTEPIVFVFKRGHVRYIFVNTVPISPLPLLRAVSSSRPLATWRRTSGDARARLLVSLCCMTVGCITQNICSE